jgi:hypothetical protein
MHLQEAGMRCIDWIDLVLGQVIGPYECGNEPSGSIQHREFLD